MDLDVLRGNPFYLDDEAIFWVLAIRNSLTLKEKIGQLFIPICVDYRKKNLQRLLRYIPGGIHQFIGTPLKTLRKTAEFLQENSSVPLLMTADIDFNIDNNFLEGTHLPNQLGVAATGDISMARRMGTVAGREGRYCGLNWSFTPNVDISYNFRNRVVSTHSFGSNPETISDMAREYITAMQLEGMAACAKHWPGEGTDDRDQHLVTIRNYMDMKHWRKTFGNVYKAVIDSGVKTIMSAHITLPAYYREKYPDTTPNGILPGTISKELNIDLLRNEFKFNGLIVSDATSMAGLTSQGPREQIVPMVIENGCDMFLFSVDDDLDLAFLMKGAESGRLSEERIEEAVTRVLALKASLGLHKQRKQGIFLPPESERKHYFRTKEHIQWEMEIAEKSITLVKDTQSLLPLIPEKHRKILIIHQETTDSYSSAPPIIIKALLEDRGFDVSEYQEDTIVDPDIFDVVLYLSDEYTGISKGNLQIKREYLQRGDIRVMNRYWHMIPTLFVSMGNPYHLYGIPRCKTYINAYSSIEPVYKALIDVLTGKKPFCGKNPVDPFCGLEDAHL